MNTAKILQQYILIKPNTFYHDGQFQALRSLENSPQIVHESGQYLPRNIVSCQADSTSCTKRTKVSSMSRRNARERRRVKLINLGYETLRDHVPAGIENKKLSKVDTLRSAVDYIKQLQDLLEATESDNKQQTQSASSSSSSSYHHIELKQECLSPVASASCCHVSSTVTSPSDSVHSFNMGSVHSSNMGSPVLSSSMESTHSARPLNLQSEAGGGLREEKVFIDIAEWLCRTSRGYPNVGMGFEGMET